MGSRYNILKMLKHQPPRILFLFLFAKRGTSPSPFGPYHHHDSVSVVKYKPVSTNNHHSFVQVFCNNLSEAHGGSYALELHTDSLHGDVCRKRHYLEWLCPHCCQVSRRAPYCVARLNDGKAAIVDSPSAIFASFAEMSRSSSTTRSPYGGRYGNSNIFGFDFEHDRAHGKLCRVTAIRDPHTCTSKAHSSHGAHGGRSKGTLTDTLRHSPFGSVSSVFDGVHEALWKDPLLSFRNSHHHYRGGTSSNGVPPPSSGYSHDKKRRIFDDKKLPEDNLSKNMNDALEYDADSTVIDRTDIPSIFDSLSADRSAITSASVVHTKKGEVPIHQEKKSEVPIQKQHKYVGSYDANGKPHGKGVMTYTSGASYSGMFKHGKRHGKVCDVLS